MLSHEAKATCLVVLLRLLLLSAHVHLAEHIDVRLLLLLAHEGVVRGSTDAAHVHSHCRLLSWSTAKAHPSASCLAKELIIHRTSWVSPSHAGPASHVIHLVELTSHGLTET